MGRIVFILFLVAAIPWAAYTWLEMRRCKGPRERAWIGRASATLWMGSLLTAIVFAQFAMRGQLFAIPVVIVLVLGARAGLRRVRARIRAEESDPLARARRLN